MSLVQNILSLLLQLVAAVLGTVVIPQIPSLAKLFGQWLADKISDEKEGSLRAFAAEFEMRLIEAAGIGVAATAQTFIDSYQRDGKGKLPTEAAKLALDKTIEYVKDSLADLWPKALTLFGEEILQKKLIGAVEAKVKLFKLASGLPVSGELLLREDLGRTGELPATVGEEPKIDPELRSPLSLR